MANLLTLEDTVEFLNLILEAQLRVGGRVSIAVPFARSLSCYFA
jgi:hypothetical protein